MQFINPQKGSNSIAFVNGKFYANPLYGRALERARAAQQEPGAHWVTIDWHHVLIRETKEGRPESQNRNHRNEAKRLINNRPRYENPQNDREARLANVIHHETASLRYDPSAAQGRAGSAEDSQNSRVALAEVANRAINSGHPERVAPMELNPTEEAALAAAARQALEGSDSTMGSTQYRLRSDLDTQTPINGKPVSTHCGPFHDTVGKPKTIVIAP